MKTSDKLSNPREIRRRLGLNQQQFWGMIGVTQSGGSRYESGRAMPKPVQHLLRLVHVDRIDISRISRADYEVVSFLKGTRPELYKKLRTQATEAGRATTRAVAAPAVKRTAVAATPVKRAAVARHA